MQSDDTWGLRAQRQQSDLVSQFRAAIGIESVPGRVFSRVKYAGRSRPAAIDFRPLTAVKFNKFFVNTYWDMILEKKRKKTNVDPPKSREIFHIF